MANWLGGYRVIANHTRTTSTSSAQTSAFNDSIEYVRVTTTGPVFIEFGANPTAVAATSSSGLVTIDSAGAITARADAAGVQTPAGHTIIAGTDGTAAVAAAAATSTDTSEVFSGMDINISATTPPRKA